MSDSNRPVGECKHGFRYGDKCEVCLLTARVAQLESILTGYHTDSKCGSCRGPLEDERDAVCMCCTLESRLFDLRKVANRALAIIAEAIMHGMPVTEEVADVRNRLAIESLFQVS